MCDQSIRRLTPDEHADRRYEELYAQVEAEDREAYDRHFGPAFRAAHPWKANGPDIHTKVMQIMDRERKAAEEQRY